ncbi:MAG: hypothetical protein PHV59_08635, partial [Victivallales bacterium]|nr:hypothetical protein [Victivallales bacterium]
CRKIIAAVPGEIAAFAAWRKLAERIAGFKPGAIEALETFAGKYSGSGVYRLTEALLPEYRGIIAAFYPEGVVERLKLETLTAASPESRIFSAFTRYGYVEGLPLSLRKILRNLFWKKLRGFSGELEFSGSFGIFTDVPCGRIYAWLAAGLKKNEYLTVKALPGWLDTDNWNFVKLIFRESARENYTVPESVENSRCRAYFLYNIGLVAIHYCRWKIVDKVLTDLKTLSTAEATAADSWINDVLTGDLALRAHRQSYVDDVLNKYKAGNLKAPADAELLILLLRLQVFLRRPAVVETAVSDAIAAVRPRLVRNKKLTRDVELLEKLRQFICADFETAPGNGGIAITPEWFKGAAYPHLHAGLWLEAAARDRLLYRNSVDMAKLLDASRAVLTPSAFRTELFNGICRLELASGPFTLGRLRNDVNRILSEPQPCATRSYPGLLMLLFASAIPDYPQPLPAFAGLAGRFSAKCSVFSPVDGKFSVLLTAPDPLKILDENEKLQPLASQTMYLWILAAARAKRSGNFAAYKPKLEALAGELCWSERLLLRRSVELLKNFEMK